jgi:hypothetical protein
LRFKIVRPQGMALISVLLFMLIFTLLSLAAMENNLLEKKMNIASWRKMQMEATGKQALARIIRQLPKQCMIKPTPVDTLLAQSFTKWQQSSCIGNMRGFLYYYVIEPMGSDACAQLACGQLPGANADYYRISVLIVDAQHITVKTFLQATVAVASPVRQVCHGKSRVIKGGVQTFRILL